MSEICVSPNSPPLANSLANFTSLYTFLKVLLAAVYAGAIGFGCTQLYDADLVYAHEDAFFHTPFMSLGLVPEAGSSVTFPRVMGKQHANVLHLLSISFTHCYPDEPK